MIQVICLLDLPEERCDFDFFLKLKRTLQARRAWFLKQQSKLVRHHVLPEGRARKFLPESEVKQFDTLSVPFLPKFLMGNKDSKPSLLPPSLTDASVESFEGALIGMAIGDFCGACVEGSSPEHCNDMVRFGLLVSTLAFQCHAHFHFIGRR